MKTVAGFVYLGSLGPGILLIAFETGSVLAPGTVVMKVGHVVELGQQGELKENSLLKLKNDIQMMFNSRSPG